MTIIPPIFSYAHLRQMPDDGKRYEILDGEVVVSPSPKRRHQRIVGLLYELLTEAQRLGQGEVYFAPFDVVLDERNVVQPDLLFVRSDRLHIITEENVQGAPDLIVEVLSEGTRERDLGAKLRIYARFGVRFYWAVDPDARTVRVYEHAPEGYRELPPLAAGDTLTCPLFPDITLPLAALFA